MLYNQNLPEYSDYMYLQGYQPHEIMEAFKHEDGVLGCVLSGAGPSMLVISHKYDLDKIKSTVKDIWEAQNIKVDCRTLKVEEQGAIVF